MSSFQTLLPFGSVFCDLPSLLCFTALAPPPWGADVGLLGNLGIETVYLGVPAVVWPDVQGMLPWNAFTFGVGLQMSSL